MKTALARMILVVSACVACAGPPVAGEKPATVPEKKWFEEAKGFEAALELQRATSADIVVYFAQYSPSDRKGLSSWFERKGLQTTEWVDGLRPYIKVKVVLPFSNKKEEALFKDFKVTKGPVLYVVQPSGKRRWINPFSWPAKGKPELRKPAEMMDELHAQSSERYQSGGETK